MAAMEGAARMRAMVFGMWVRFLDTMHFHERTTEGMHLGKWPGPVEEVSVGAVTVGDAMLVAPGLRLCAFGT